MSLRGRLSLAVLVLAAGMLVTGVLAVLALRAQAGAIERAEHVFTDELGPVIDLAQALPDARRALPDRPTASAASPEDATAWRAASQEITTRLIRVRDGQATGATAELARSAVESWIEARGVGDQLVNRPATAEDILAFDRPFRRLRADVAGLLGELRPAVAEPIEEAPQELARLSRWLGGAIVAITLFSLAAAAALLRSLLGSVSAVRTAAFEMAGGDLDARAPVPPGEFGDLASVLNVMAERLAVERSGLTERATRDGLTGVLNSREIKERLEQEVERSRRHEAPLGVVMLDLDHFKRVNDVHGHLAGDHALTSFARSIESVLRPADLVGRYGGEEFLVVLPEADPEATRVVAERIRQVVADTPVALQGGATLALTTSAGAASSAGGTPDATTLIAAADGALYRAKREGRDRVVVDDDPDTVTVQPS